MRPARAVIVGGRDVVRAGLEHTLHGDPGIHLVATAHNGRRGIQLSAALEPDVVLLDQVLPDIGPAEFCARVSRAGTGVLVLSTDVGDAAISASIRAGARGFVHLGIGGGDLQSAVRAVARGDAVLDPVIARRVVGWIRERPVGRGHGLSPREAEVIRLMAGGSPDRAIATTLGVSQNTVKTYLRRALGKLQCRTRSEAAAAVARAGMLDGAASPRLRTSA